MRLSGLDEEVLRDLACLLGELAARDLAERVFLGEAHTNEDFARRKREIAALSSARWAGTIVRGSNEQWALARRAQAAHLESLTEAIHAIASRLAVPVAACSLPARMPGYGSQYVRSGKQRRLQQLTAHHARITAEREAGHVRVVHGGKRLLHARLHLDEARLTLPEWQQRWEDARSRIEADGESGKKFGNQSLQVDPVDGSVLVKLPPELAARYAHHCDRYGRYRLEATASFAYRSMEWSGHVRAHRSVGYTIRFEQGRCYLTAAFTPARPELPEGMDGEALLRAARAGGVLGIDHNADHLALWQLDVHGNPVGRPHRIDVDYTGSTSRRDAQVRHACSRLIRLARETGTTVLVIEDLGFDTGRDTCGGPTGRRGKAFRATVAGMPTAKFAARLVAMAHRAGLAVIIVDPAYTSRWGAQYWRKTTSSKHFKTSGHEAASLVIGRRGQGLGARRRAEKTVPREQTEATHARRQDRRRRVGTEDHRSHAASAHQPSLAAHPGSEPAPRTTHTMRAAKGPRKRSSPPSTVRGGPSSEPPVQGLTNAQC